jgi:hypothetical protein
MLQKSLSVLTPERLSAALVYVSGAVVGSYAAKGMEPVQWAGAAVAIAGAVAVAVMIRTWPSKVTA